MASSVAEPSMFSTSLITPEMRRMGPASALSKSQPQPAQTYTTSLITPEMGRMGKPKMSPRSAGNPLQVFATSLMTPEMKKVPPQQKTMKMKGDRIEPDEGWGDKLSQRHIPGYSGCVPEMQHYGTGSSYSEGTYRLAGNYPNRMNAPEGIAKPKIWDSVKGNDFTAHSSEAIHRNNDGMAAAGILTESTSGVPLGFLNFGEPDLKPSANIDANHPSRRTGAQTLLGPSDTESSRALHNHTFTNQMTFEMRNEQIAQTNRNTQPLTGKNIWPEVVGLDGLEAKRIIQREAGSKIKIELIPRGSRISEDIKGNRVRIFVRADNNRVASAPRIA